MRYFSTLPQNTFTSTIGNFTIASFFSYYEYEDSLINKVTQEVDNKTTLTELSYRVYQDNNSLWLFLLANNITDPYELLSESPALYVQNNQNNISLGIQPYSSPSGTVVVGAGSILAPFANTYGSPWEYSSIGSWDLDGSFALVDNTDYYNGTVTIKEQKNGVDFIGIDAANDDISVIQSTGSTYSTDNSSEEPIYQTKNKVSPINDIVYISQYGSGKIQPTDNNYGSVAAAAPGPTADSGPTFGISNYDIVTGKNKNIYILPAGSLPSLTLKSFSY
jgi:hypothetical protein